MLNLIGCTYSSVSCGFPLRLVVWGLLEGYKYFTVVFVIVRLCLAYYRTPSANDFPEEGIVQFCMPLQKRQSKKSTLQPRPRKAICIKTHRSFVDFVSFLLSSKQKACFLPLQRLKSDFCRIVFKEPGSFGQFHHDGVKWPPMLPQTRSLQMTKFTNVYRMCTKY